MPSTATVWEAPECPFQIEFAAEKLDEIRLAVVEAFYAVPRGGIEIGGVLFGRRDEQRLYIEDYRLIECEHKTGPSFQLSEKDQAGLRALIAAGPGEALGWFHSHTRSDLSFSAADLEIHNKFFPERWQAALVLRPANMQPTRAAYFFRDAAGRVATEKSSREFVVEPLFREEKKKVRSAPLNGAPHAAPVAAVVPPPVPVQHEPVRPVMEPEPEREYVEMRQTGGQTWVWVAVFALILALAAGAYFTQPLWMPRPPQPLNLQASDVDGKLFVRWNPVRNTTGKLSINDGGKETVIPLDSVQVGRGFYVYARQADKTIVRMNAGAAQDLTTFAGPLGPHGPTPEEMEKAKQEELRVKEDLQNQTLKNRALQRRVKELSNQLKEQKP